MRRTMTGMVLMIATVAVPLGAQVVVQPGAKVRVTAPTVGIQRFRGTLITTGDTLDVARGGVRVRVPSAAVTHLELSRGRSRLAGAGRGAIWGAGIGLALGAITTSQREALGPCLEVGPGGECESYSAGEWLVMNTAGGAIWGALIGAIVGREDWDVIARPAAARTSMALRPWIAPDGRVGLVATMR